MMPRAIRLLLAAALVTALVPTTRPVPMAAQGDAAQVVPPAAYGALRWRNVGGARGGRVTGLAGVRQQPHTFYIGSSGGGVWKTDDAGINWYPVGDGEITTGSIGSIDVAPSSPNHVWVGTG
ncbi:MAG: WD40/YVTN/BNR-like repeat-containing protein, partial [Vicinamibacterales bacterium]